MERFKMSHADLRYLIYLDTASPRLWRWTLYAGNNRKIANSGEGYINYDDCIAAIDLVASSHGAPIHLTPEAQTRRTRATVLGGRRY
jgi:uncharacterized protein YegP (UPF0339 family)